MNCRMSHHQKHHNLWLCILIVVCAIVFLLFIILGVRVCACMYCNIVPIVPVVRLCVGYERRALIRNLPVLLYSAVSFSVPGSPTASSWHDLLPTSSVSEQRSRYKAMSCCNFLSLSPLALYGVTVHLLYL